MFIYLIVNHDTGKYYVGQHKGNNLRKYLQTKMSVARQGRGGNSHLFNSMRKHPFPSSWSIHALRADIQTKAELDKTEKDFIKFLRSQDPEYGYNICRGGEGFTGPHTEESRKKMSALTQKLWQRPEHRNIISRAAKKMWQRPGHRENVIAKNTGQIRSPEIKAKLAKVLEHARMSLPAHPSEESNIKRSQKLRGRIISESTRMKISQSRLGRAVPFDVREKISQTLTGVLKHLPVSPKAAAARIANLEKGRLKKRKLQVEQAKKPKPLCSVNECGKISKACNLCSAHLQRKYRHGNPLEGKPIREVGRRQ